MARSKHTRNGRRRLPARIIAGARTAILSRAYREQEEVPGTHRPTEAELRDALAAVPDDLHWEWVQPRITPLFERDDAGGVDGDPTLHVVSALGVAVGFGIEVGPMFLPVTRSLAERWEASIEQIEHAAFAHLDRAVEPLGPAILQHVVHRGHVVRSLTEPGGWASSVILAGEPSITRLFGSRDQVVTTPARNVLLSFDAATPASVILDLCLLMEGADPHPNRIDPFRLTDGRLSWDGLMADPGLETPL